MSGPGVGTLIGLAWGDALNERDFAAERDRLQRELAAANAEALGAKATKDASKAVLDAVVSELAAEQAGTLKVRRLSDPGNIAGRNEAFMDTAAGQLRRLSDGSLQFSVASTLRVKRAKVELKDVLADPALAPKLDRKTKPR
jgi:hypothetical protein